MSATQLSKLPASRLAVRTVSNLKSMSAEKANQLTHGFGFGLSVVGAVYLITALMQGAEFYQWLGCGVYLAALLALYLASTLSHSFESGPWREFYRTLDQTCIFIFSAASFTPFALQYLADGWWWLLIASWGLALAGCLLKIYVAKEETVTVLVYLAVGWLPALAWRPLYEHVPFGAKLLIAAGAVFYTLGTLFLVNDHRGRFWHATWHLFVVAATACIYLSLLDCLALAG